MSDAERRSACHRRGKAVTTAIVWLLLGAIVNVAVAWGCALRLPAATILNSNTAIVKHESALLMIQQRRGDTRITIQGTKRVSLPNTEEISLAEFHAIVPHGSVFGDMQWIANELAAARPAQGDSVLFEHSHGWPMLAMSGWASVTRTTQGRPTVEARGLKEIGPLRLGPLSTKATYRRTLPLHPLWPGSAINTLFYAVVLWLLFAAPFALRRWRRTKRGLCTKCGYDLRKRPSDSSVCPECGTCP
jgi:hypothetical protein